MQEVFEKLSAQVQVLPCVRPVGAAVHCRWPVWRSRIGSIPL